MAERALRGWLAVVLVWGALWGCAFATPAAVLDVAGVPHRAIALSPYFEMLEDPDRALTLADVRSPAHANRFQTLPNPSKAINLGITKSALWVRMQLRNSSATPGDHLLEIAHSRLGLVDFYGLNAAGDVQQAVHTGYFRPFSERAYANRHFVFPVVVGPGGNLTVYLRVESQASLELPSKLWTRADFVKYERTDYMVQAAFFGLIGGSVLFNLLLWASLRDSSYLLYLFFVIFNTLGIASSTGMGNEFLWPNSPKWSNISFSVSALLTGVGLIAFTRYMVGTRKYLPRLDQVLKALIVVDLLTAAFMFYAYVVQLTMIVVITNIFFAVWAMGVQSWKGHRGAQIFLAAFVVLIMGVVTINLRMSGMVDTNLLTQNGVQIGAAIETIVLAFALADRIHLVRAEKDQAQREALLAERQLVDSLRSSERLLEVRVQERTAELSRAVEDLQKTQAELVEAEKLASLGALVAGVAHELNTPIGNALTTASTIQDAAHAMKQSLESGALKRSLLDTFIDRNMDMARLVVRSCERAAALITSFKRVAVDQTSEHQRVFDLAELVEDNINALRPSYKSANWVIESQLVRGIECNSYPGPLGQVLTNLVQNALLHGFAGREQGTVTITSARQGDWIELVVSDDGNGMPEETLVHIFEPFFTTALGKGGSGLGLAVCRNLVMGVMGGSIRAESRIGQGSRFVVRVPMVAPHSVKPPGVAPPGWTLG